MNAKDANYIQYSFSFRFTKCSIWHSLNPSTGSLIKGNEKEVHQVCCKLPKHEQGNALILKPTYFTADSKRVIIIQELLFSTEAIFGSQSE